MQLHFQWEIVRIAMHMLPYAYKCLCVCIDICRCIHVYMVASVLQLHAQCSTAGAGTRMYLVCFTWVGTTVRNPRDPKVFLASLLTCLAKLDFAMNCGAMPISDNSPIGSFGIKGSSPPLLLEGSSKLQIVIN